MSSKSLLLGSVLALVASHVKVAFAQGTNVTCLQQFSWMDNSRGQSPCLIAAYLNSACLSDPTDAYVYSLPEDYHYRPPTAQLATPCQCSTVFYSMIGACATCQERSNLPWSSWQTNCSTDYISVWPKDIPPGTSIPAWAYLDVLTPDTFNATVAQAVAAEDPPESSAIPRATPTPSHTSTAGGDSTPLLPPSQLPTSPTGLTLAGSSKKNNTGAIVGGVIGGIAGAAIIAGTIAFFVLRSRKTCPSKAYTNGTAPPPPGFVPIKEKAVPRGEMPAPNLPPAYAAPTPIRPMPAPSFSHPSVSPASGPYNSSVSQSYAPSHQPSAYAHTTSSASRGPSGYATGYTGVAEV